MVILVFCVVVIIFALYSIIISIMEIRKQNSRPSFENQEEELKAQYIVESLCNELGISLQSEEDFQESD